MSVVHHDGNKGYAVATETALQNVPGDVVMVVDGDGQHTMADAPLFLTAIDQGYDVVFLPWKKVRHDPVGRLILSRGLRILSHWILGSPLHDINAGCRAFRKDVGGGSRSSTGSTSWATRSTRAAGSRAGRSPRSS